MHKSIFAIFFAGILVMSVIAPTILVLSDVGMDTIVNFSFSEEETKNGEKEIVEKDLVLDSQYMVDFETNSLKSPVINFYTENTSTFIPDILLPPPEQVS